MIAYRLELINEDHIDIYFETHKQCELSVTKERTYIFSYEDDQLVIKIKMPSDLGSHEFDIKSVTPIKAENMKSFSITKSLTNCCSIGPKEWCVKNGCMDAPCGRICD